MNGIFDVVAGVLLVAGALFSMIAAIGVLRFPDLFTRMHAASKAGSAGAGLALLALAFHSAEFNVVSRALAGLAFIFFTTPVSAHLLARAAYLSGYRPLPGTHVEPQAEESLSSIAQRRPKR